MKRTGTMVAVALALSLLAAPLVAEAQQAGKGRSRRGAGRPTGEPADELRRAFRELGWVVGQNIVFEFRWAGDSLNGSQVSQRSWSISKST